MVAPFPARMGAHGAVLPLQDFVADAHGISAESSMHGFSADDDDIAFSLSRSVELRDSGAPQDAVDDRGAASLEGRRAAAMYRLVGTQHADGSWAWDETVLRHLGLERADCGRVFAGLGLEPALLEKVAPTLLALGLLARDHASDEPQWRPLADKALGWLAAKGVAAPAGAATLESWLASALP